MSHAAQEATHGAPREAFTFARGTDVWRYIAADAAITRESLTFSPAAITRGPIERAQRGGRGEVEVTLPLALPVAEALLATSPIVQRMVCTIHRFHATDGATPELVVIYTGEVSAYRVEGNAVTLTLRNVLAALDRPCLSVLFQRTCNNVLGDHRCGVSLADHTETVTVSAVDGAQVTVTAAGTLTAGDYAGGVLQWGDLRFDIERHEAGDTSDEGVLTLHPAPDASIASESVDIVPGCDKTRATCADRFGNLDRFLGFDRMPVTNPFQHGF